MIRGQTVIGIIPARGGSKRLSRKNIASLAGKPLLSYTIEAGLKTRYVDELMVSTDDREIADIAVSCGANVPCMRPKKLATDESGTIEVIEHVLQHYADRGRTFDITLLLQPTSPLRDHADIDQAFEYFDKKNADSVISVCEAEHSPLWTNRLPASLSMKGFIDRKIAEKRGQDLPKYYRLNGAIFICKTNKLLKRRSFFLRDKAYAFIMPQEKSIDIDTSLDLTLCEVLIKESTGMN